MYQILTGEQFMAHHRPATRDERRAAVLAWLRTPNLPTPHQHLHEAWRIDDWLWLAEQFHNQEKTP